MSLRDMMTASASTSRQAAASSGISGDYAANLSNVLITPVMLFDTQGLQRVLQAQGLEGAAIHKYQCFTESHAHTDSGSPVDQVPDIVVGDRLIVGSTTYTVTEAEIEPATFGFGITLILFLSKDK